MSPLAASAVLAHRRGFSAPAFTDAGRWLAGRPVEEAARLIPRVFNLCAAAHGAASAQALHLPAPDAEASIRQETLRDHALALFHQGPEALGLPGERDALGLLANPDGAAELARRVSGDVDLAGLSLSDFDLWLARGETLPARLLRQMRQHIDPAWGRVGLPSLTLSDLDAAVGDGSRDLPARDATVLTRVRQAPLLVALLAAEGGSLLARLLARVLDLLAVLKGGPASCGRTAAGNGFAAAARGLLAHGARVEAGRIAFYRIVPPSAWTLAPGGLLERMLAALPSRAETPMLGRLALLAVNPCVPVKLEGLGG